MANNRMYLCHVPSGYYVPLGKRMGWGWYNVPQDLSERLQRLYDAVESQEAEGDQDAFALIQEGTEEYKRLKHNVTLEVSAN